MADTEGQRNMIWHSITKDVKHTKHKTSTIYDENKMTMKRVARIN